MITVKSSILFFLIALLCCSFLQLNAQKPIWVSQLAGTGDCDAHVCKIAPNGNIYIAGSFSGTLDADPGANTYNLYSNGSKDIFLACYKSNGTFIWGLSAGGPGTDVVANLAVDKDNNPIIVGQISGQNIDFEPSPVYKYIHAKGGVDGFIAKYTPTGSFVWGHNFGGNSPHDNTLSVAADANGNVYAGGDFHENMDVDPDAIGKYILNSLSGTAYLVKYTATGQFLWGFNFGAGGLAAVDNAVWSINATDNGHVYIAGCYEGKNIDFDPSPTSVYNLSAAGGYDAFVAKYTDAGTFEFATSLHGSRVDQAFDMAVDNNHDVYITGYTESPALDFGGGAVSTPGGNGKSDVFLAKYNSAGKYQWGYVWGAAGTDVGWGVSVSNNNLYCTGYFRDTIDADPTTGVDMLYGSGQNDIYISKFELDGTFICAFNIGADKTDVGRKLTFNKNGDLLLSGLFSGSNVDFDPLGSTHILNGQGYDGFFALYDWANTYAPPAGYLIGDTICSGRQAYFTFISTAGNAPFTITFTDGVKDYIVSNVNSGQAFPLPESPLTTTTYKLKRIQGSGLCAPYAEPNTPVTILVYPSPLADAGPDTSVCPGALVTLRGSGAGDYEWYPKEGISDPFIPDPLLYVNENTVRRIIVTNSFGCKDTNAVTIDIIPADFKTEPFVNICIGDTLQLQAYGGDTYEWTGNSNISNNTIANPFIWPATDNIYTVLIKDTVCGRAATLDVIAYVHPLPDIKIVQAKDIDCGLKAGKLLAVGGATYQWNNTNTLNDASIPDPIATPAENTMYVVTGTDVNGCSNKDSADINVYSGNGRLYAPTAFTPNNDGKNDRFRIIIPGEITDYELSVFNRFGQRVFFTENYISGWDGRFNSADQPLGTYYYYYKAHSSVCDEIFGKGDVHLVR